MLLFMCISVYDNNMTYAHHDHSKICHHPSNEPNRRPGYTRVNQMHPNVIVRQLDHVKRQTDSKETLETNPW